MIRLLRMLMVGWTLALGAASWSQTLEPGVPVPIEQGPPPIAFDAWRQVASDEFKSEYVVEFPSAFTTGVQNNDLVRLNVFVPTGTSGPVPTVIVLHYWGATNLAVERTLAQNLAVQGIAAVVMTLPYHLSRTPPGAVSGRLAIQPDTGHLVRTMTLSVLDIRRTVDWIVSRPEFRSDRIGLTGTSLGAVVGALGFAVEPRITAAAFVLGGADLARILWGSSLLPALRDDLRRQGYTEDRLREELATVEPLRYLQSDDPRPTFVVSARYDSIMPPSATARLTEALGEPKTLVLDTGHYGGALVQGRLMRTLARYFGDELNGRSFTPPASFYAPTIRFGLGYNPENGPQVAVGLDVWRSNANADAFATILLTPKGLQGFVGTRISRDLAVGATVLPRRTTWGVFWSIVL